MTVEYGVYSDHWWFDPDYKQNKEEQVHFPQFPTEWDAGRISRGPSGPPIFRKEAPEPDDEIRKDFLWYPSPSSPKFYDESQLKKVKELAPVTSLMSVGKRSFVMKTCGFNKDEDELQSRIENEVWAYKLLEGKGIAPPFRGFVRQDQKVVGFLIDYISDSRPPEDSNSQDMALCRELIKKLHQLNIVHGDAEAEGDEGERNCIISDKEKRAYLVDFEHSTLPNRLKTFAKDLAAFA